MQRGTNVKNKTERFTKGTAPGIGTEHINIPALPGAVKKKAGKECGASIFSLFCHLHSIYSIIYMWNFRLLNNWKTF